MSFHITIHEIKQGANFNGIMKCPFIPARCKDSISIFLCHLCWR